VFLVPCNWSGDFYVSLEPGLKSKIRIWPAGVELPALDTQEKKYDFLIYDKIGDHNLVDQIIEELSKRSLSYTLLNYGYFKQKDYFKALSESKSLIYLSGSESQGLALFEAWARGVPSLVWERGYWKYKNYEWNNSKSGPYVTEENGMTFRDLGEFQTSLPIFLSKEFKARKFIEDEFTLEKAADKYLTIYKSHI
jgi:glycosyltransferase involved in cell wall biosynthesis